MGKGTIDTYYIFNLIISEIVINFLVTVIMEFDDDWNIDDVVDHLQMDQYEGIQRDRVILKNLPAELSSDGIRNICQEYGTITDINRPSERSYAFVTFKSAA